MGTLLLWIPTAWALWLANQGLPEISVLLFLGLGTIVMRSAGCVINDIADRHVDKHVQRTKARPLTASEVSLPAAWGLFLGLCLVAYGIVTQLPRACFYYALPALMVTFLYPFCKRFLSAPQLILGVAFSMGIPISYVASHQSPNLSMLLLCLINFLWIVAYDTMYAMTDKDDDLRIGVKSTAVLFGTRDKTVILSLQVIAHGLWIVLALREQLSVLFFACWGVALLVLVYQQMILRRDTPDACMKAFAYNAWYGGLLWLGLC